jgi:hypothetical protein
LTRVAFCIIQRRRYITKETSNISFLKKTPFNRRKDYRVKVREIGGKIVKKFSSIFVLFGLISHKDGEDLFNTQ